MSSKDSVSYFKLRRTIEQLAAKEGRGTELITQYVPPDRRIYEVINNLKEEYGTASNIKSRTTRKNVQEAIERVIQRLKLFKEPPPTGLVIFCGAIPHNGPGSEEMEIYTLTPPEPITVGFYRCDSRFHLEPLQELLAEKDPYGILVIDSTEAVVALLKGRRLEVFRNLTSGVGGKQKKGGQSARRFERIREQEINAYFKRVAQSANESFLQVPDLKGIILGGPGPTKYDFQEGHYLNYMLEKKIVGVIDTSYVGEAGAEEVVEKSPDILQGVRYADEKKLVQKYLYEVGHESGMAANGEETVRNHLVKGVVETLLLSERVASLKLNVTCSNCGYSERRSIPSVDLIRFESSLTTSSCPNCQTTNLRVTEKRDVVDEFLELAEKNGAKVEIISSETEEGQQLLKGFGGIAAILRFPSR